MSLVCSMYQDMHWSSVHRPKNFLILDAFEMAVASVIRAVARVHLQFVVFSVHRILEVAVFMHTRGDR